MKEKYGEAALRVSSGGSSCCGAAPAGTCCDPITSNLYHDAQTGQLPEEAVLASLGCGNPTALAKLNPGDTVLDLGSGGGIDVLLSARRVGPTGKAYGLDMTDEMLALANENKRKAGVDQRRIPERRNRAHPAARRIRRRHHFQLRHQSFRRQRSRFARSFSRFEARRPLRRFRCRHPRRNLTGDSQNVLLWVGCVAGALEENEYREKLASAGFAQIEMEPTRIYRVEDAREFPQPPRHRRGRPRAPSGWQNS